MELFESGFKVWDKDDGGQEVDEAKTRDVKNPVTEADLKADAILQEDLLALLPGSGWLSEETADSPQRLGCRAVWIVDPIDGTREYTEGVPEFAISVGLALDGQVVLGVLFNPAKNDLFTGRIGGGVFRNGEACAALQRDEFSGSTLLASRTETRRGEFEPFRQAMEIREVGSTAYKLALVAGGEAHVYLTRKPRSEWDVAAGVMLCLEAGAAVTDLGGEPHRFNRENPRCRGVVVAAPGIHAEVMDQIAAIGTLE